MKKDIYKKNIHLEQMEEELVDYIIFPSQFLRKMDEP